VDRSASDGLQCCCKTCQKLYYDRHRERILKRHHGYYLAHAEELKENAKTYRENNAVSCKARAKAYREKNREKVLEGKRAAYYAEQEKNTEKSRKYRGEHRQELNAKRLTRRQMDLNFRIKCNLRIRLSVAVKKGRKGGSAVECLGLSIVDFKKYLESLFYPNAETGEAMSWDNYGRRGWHIDHIQALSLFDLSEPSQVEIACHYSNLQPLWHTDNERKGNRQMGRESCS